MCVCEFMWWHSSQSCPCGLWCGRVPLQNLIRVFAYIMAKRNRKERGRLEEVKESSISVIIFKRPFWWFDMVNFAKSYIQRKAAYCLASQLRKFHSLKIKVTSNMSCSYTETLAFIQSSVSFFCSYKAKIHCCSEGGHAESCVWQWLEVLERRLALLVEPQIQEEQCRSQNTRPALHPLKDICGCVEVFQTN